MPSNEKAKGNDDSSDGKVTNIRKCAPRCIICCEVSDPIDKGSNTTQTTIYCLICLMSLFTKRIGSTRTTCFKCFLRQDKTLFRVQGHMGVMLMQEQVKNQLEGESNGEGDAIK